MPAAATAGQGRRRGDSLPTVEATYGHLQCGPGQTGLWGFSFPSCRGIPTADPSVMNMAEAAGVSELSPWDPGGVTDKRLLGDPGTLLFPPCPADHLLFSLLSVTPHH